MCTPLSADHVTVCLPVFVCLCFWLFTTVIAPTQLDLTSPLTGWQNKPTHISTQFNLTTQDRMSLPFSFCLSEEDSSSGVTSHAVSPSISPPHVSFPLTHRKLRACCVAKEHGSFLSEILFLFSLFFPLILCGLSLYFQHLWTNSKHFGLIRFRNPI